jgi:cystine transport system permease protein
VNFIDLDLILKSAPFLLKGAGYTVLLSVGSMVIGLSLGLAIALARLSPWPLLRRLAQFYVSFIRGTPLLVQLFVIYYGLAQFGLRIDPIPSALIGLSLNVAGYTGEILRAAIGGVERGQWEAARALGLSWSQAMRHVVLPQAARAALPGLGNSFISLVKDTSLAATIQVPELFRQAQLITARTFQIFTMYITAALLYWLISTALTWGQLRLERRFSRQFR